MPYDIPQFGIEPKEGYTEKISAYAIVFDKHSRILSLEVRGTFHLPGGGINSNEDPEIAVIREAQEEAGCEISDLQYVGKANQFYTDSKEGQLNKIATFYIAELKNIDITKKTEADHEVRWLTPEEFINANSGEFQKWAVKKALEKIN